MARWICCRQADTLAAPNRPARPAPRRTGARRRRPEAGQVVAGANLQDADQAQARCRCVWPASWRRPTKLPDASADTPTQLAGRAARFSRPLASDNRARGSGAPPLRLGGRARGHRGPAPPWASRAWPNQFGSLACWGRTAQPEASQPAAGWRPFGRHQTATCWRRARAGFAFK